MTGRGVLRQVFSRFLPGHVPAFGTELLAVSFPGMLTGNSNDSKKSWSRLRVNPVHLPVMCLIRVSISVIDKSPEYTYYDANMFTLQPQ